MLKNQNKDGLLEQLLECDVIVYDITQDPEQVDEACWAISALHNELERIDKPKIFILISTVMTWAKTKPVDPVIAVLKLDSNYLNKFLIIFHNNNRKNLIFHLLRKTSEGVNHIRITKNTWLLKKQ